MRIPAIFQFISNIPTAYLYAFAIILSILSGCFQIDFLVHAGHVITDSFVKIFKCVSLPIVALSLIVILSEIRESYQVKKIGTKALFYTVSTTLIAASLTAVLYIVIAPENIDMVQNMTKKTFDLNGTHYLGYLTGIIPSNIFEPFIQHQVMGVLFLSILIGIAVSYIPDKEAQTSIKTFFKGLHSLLIVLTSWIVAIIPVALFGFLTTTIVHLKNGMDIAGLGQYFLVVVSANIIQGFLILPLFLYSHRIAPFRALTRMLPALSVAFFTKSSTGALPVTMSTIENRLQVTPQVSRFVLPLCTAINMNGCAAFIFATVVYVMQNNGVEISLTTMIVWIGVATITAIGNAGVPMGCFFLSASLLTSIGIPIEILGLILPFYGIVDMFETALNVWSDSCVTTVIDRKLKHERPAEKPL